MASQRSSSPGFRVALVANTGWNMTRHRAPLLEGLLAQGCEVVAVADFDDRQAETIRQLGARTLSLPVAPSGQNPLKDLIYLVGLTRIFVAERPDLAHLFTIKPVVYGSLAAKLAGVQAIVVSLTGRGILGADRKRWLQPLLRLLLRSALSGRVQATFENREDMTWFVERGLVDPANASFTAGTGIDTQALRPADDPPVGARRTFVMAARMLWSKGVADFAEAARRVHAICPMAKFVLYGGVSDDYGSHNPDFIDRSWLEELHREGIVSWQGWTEPSVVEEAIRSAAAVVLPSYYAEGVPRILLEAAAAGVPMITTDTPGCRDAVVPGQTGYLCPPRSPEHIAAAMLQVLGDPERSQAMGRAARQRATTLFDIRSIVEHMLQVYMRTTASARFHGERQPNDAR